MTSTAFLTMMFTSFLAETDPASSNPKPERYKNVPSYQNVESDFTL